MNGLELGLNIIRLRTFSGPVIATTCLSFSGVIAAGLSFVPRDFLRGPRARLSGIALLLSPSASASAIEADARMQKPREIAALSLIYVLLNSTGIGS